MYPMDYSDIHDIHAAADRSRAEYESPTIAELVEATTDQAPEPAVTYALGLDAIVRIDHQDLVLHTHGREPTPAERLGAAISARLAGDPAVHRFLNNIARRHSGRKAL